MARVAEVARLRALNLTNLHLQGAGRRQARTTSAAPAAQNSWPNSGTDHRAQSLRQLLANNTSRGMNTWRPNALGRKSPAERRRVERGRKPRPFAGAGSGQGRHPRYPATPGRAHRRGRAAAFRQTVGGVVTPAQQLMIVAPEAGHLEIEAWIENVDTGFVAQNQTAEIRIESFPAPVTALSMGGGLAAGDAVPVERWVWSTPPASALARNTMRVETARIFV